MKTTTKAAATTTQKATTAKATTAAPKTTTKAGVDSACYHYVSGGGYRPGAQLTWVLGDKKRVSGLAANTTLDAFAATIQSTQQNVNLNYSVLSKGGAVSGADTGNAVFGGYLQVKGGAGTPLTYTHFGDAEAHYFINGSCWRVLTNVLKASELN